MGQAPVIESMLPRLGLVSQLSAMTPPCATNAATFAAGAGTEPKFTVRLAWQVTVNAGGLTCIPLRATKNVVAFPEGACRYCRTMLVTGLVALARATCVSKSFGLPLNTLFSTRPLLKL